jgi:phospholipase C
MSNILYVLLYVLVGVGVALLLFRMGVAVRTYFRLRGKMLVTCPETKKPAAVDVDAKGAAEHSILTEPYLRLSECSRWPERQGCGQECLSQIEAAPEECLVRTLVAKWFAGKACAYCGRPIEGIDWLGGQRPARGASIKVALTWVVLLWVFGTVLAHAQISRFEHIVVMVQENRTPDNLFYSLCLPPFGTSTSCSTTPTGSQYNIQTSNWLDKQSPSGTTQPKPVPLGNGYGLDHTHDAFVVQCDANAKGACAMDGAGDVKCLLACPAKPQFAFVENTTGTLDPYLQLVTQYGWANYMFQTNQGASFPAHQFLFGGTSAPTASDDAMGIFAAENMLFVDGVTNKNAGCIADATTTVGLIGSKGGGTRVYPCFEHKTIPDILPAQFSWRYYSPGAGNIWTAPVAISHICQSTGPDGTCQGLAFTDNVDLTPSDVLKDIRSCNLRSVSWVIPTFRDSDHPANPSETGPSWVASLVNAVGNQPQCPDGEIFWHNTAILITWDDWGGWYDHEPPTILSGVEGDYQYGFRVPLIVVSAYTPAGYVNNARQDFGSLLRFIEHNFGIPLGKLNFADHRATSNVAQFFHLNEAPRHFQTISAPLDADYFLNDKTPPADPDDY